MTGSIFGIERQFLPCPFCGKGMVFVCVQIGTRTDQRVMAWACGCNQPESKSNRRIAGLIAEAQHVEPLKIE